MRIDGHAGALVTADRGIDLPTGPVRYPDHLADTTNKWAIRSPIPPPAPPQPRASRPAPVTPARPAGPARRTTSATRRRPDTLAPTTRTLAGPASPAGPVASGLGARVEEWLELGAQRIALARRLAIDPQIADRQASGAERHRAAEEAAAVDQVRHVQAVKTRLVQDLCERWATGETQRQIAADLGISVPTLQRLRREHGIERRRKALDRAQVVRLYAEYRSVEQVAAALDTSTAGVRYQLARAGVPVRRPGDNGTRRPEADRAGALAANQSGQPVADIHARYGITETTLHRWRRAADIPPRTPSTRSPRRKGRP